MAHMGVYRCDDCGVEAMGDALPDAERLYERLDEGGIYTTKQCEVCGALAYPVLVGAAVPVRRVVVTGAELLAGLAATFQRRHDASRIAYQQTGGTKDEARTWAAAARELLDLSERLRDRVDGGAA